MKNTLVNNLQNYMAYEPSRGLLRKMAVECAERADRLLGNATRTEKHNQKVLRSIAKQLFIASDNIQK